MGKTRGLFCMCDSGVAHCQSQHQCHLWPMTLMFKAHCMLSLAAVNQINVFHEAMKGCKNLKIHKRLALKM